MSRMVTKLAVDRPEDVQFTLSITMSLADWRRLQEQLHRDWPSWEISTAIRRMVAQATQQFEPPSEDT